MAATCQGTGHINAQKDEKNKDRAHLITTLYVGAKYRVEICQIGVARWFRCTLAPPNKGSCDGGGSVVLWWCSMTDASTDASQFSVFYQSG
ncbi:hypothetical protein WN48_07205 [Eufriesea mexicana]|uniref:Uncharacterized protein n=1 Tax=Eufriesea mexicana TaxID=516756 RepID=A0A310SHZ2_9HYME|nr:hypothetical protein WN48_07205 [Eufriesea mexicana]